MATRRQPRPRPCDQVLEPTHRAIPTDMLEDDQAAARYQHAPDLAEGSAHIIDRAQHQSDVYRLETVVRERNRLRNPIDNVERNAATAGKRRSHPPKRRLRLHRGYRRHPGRNKQQVRSRPDADHQQPACRIPHRLSAVPVIEQLAEDRHAESVNVRKQRITSRYVLPRSSRNGGYSSRINETYTATR